MVRCSTVLYQTALPAKCKGGNYNCIVCANRLTTSRAVRQNAKRVSDGLIQWELSQHESLQLVCVVKNCCTYSISDCGTIFLPFLATPRSVATNNEENPACAAVKLKKDTVRAFDRYDPRDSCTGWVPAFDIGPKSLTRWVHNQQQLPCRVVRIEAKGSFYHDSREIV